MREKFFTVYAPIAIMLISITAFPPMTMAKIESLRYYAAVKKEKFLQEHGLYSLLKYTPDMDSLASSTSERIFDGGIIERLRNLSAYLQDFAQDRVEERNS